jgi:hypothetical protein
VTSLDLRAFKVAARWLAAEDQSLHPTVVEYGVRMMMKRKGPRAAAQVTAKKLSGEWEIPLLGVQDSSIDPKVLEGALWDRLVDQVVENIGRFKPGTEEIALGAALDHFKQGRATEAKLRKLVVRRLRRDPWRRS